VSNWPSAKASRVLAALLRIGWSIKRQPSRAREPLQARSAESGVGFIAVLSRGWQVPQLKGELEETIGSSAQ
jgi:hypothetical protein